MDDLEAAFHERALKIYEDAKKEVGYRATRFLLTVRKQGGLAAAKRWLKPSAKATQGFVRLLDYDRLNLSVEAVALQDPWKSLFTEQELKTAHERLDQYGYFRRPARILESSQLSGDELSENDIFPEGARRTIAVSAYERDPEARRRCIEHFGAVCYVCGFDFQETYGEIGKGFIHVHHLTPFAAQTDSRFTDPKTDLRPVCPNCHCMLHWRNPPIPITELKLMMKK